jgi:hypothetical protein
MHAHCNASLIVDVEPLCHLQSWGARAQWRPVEQPQALGEEFHGDNHFFVVKNYNQSATGHNDHRCTPTAQPLQMRHLLSLSRTAQQQCTIRAWRRCQQAEVHPVKPTA